MKFFLDFLPGLAFLIALFIPENRQDGVYLATKVLIAASFLQLLISWLITKKIEKQYIIIFLVVLLLGWATLFFQDERFIKWKPTLVFWVFSLAFLASEYIGSKSLTVRFMGQFFDAPGRVWYWANMSFVGFFLASGFINLFVAYTFSTEIWATFKLFGFLILNFIYLLGLFMFLSRYLIEQAETDKK